MRQAVQYCVGLPNAPGMLAKLCEDLRAHNVNIEAVFVSNDRDYAWVNFIATPIEHAEQALLDGEYKFFAEDVLVVPLKNRTGELGNVAAKLADAGVNINYVYGSGMVGDSIAVVLAVDDMKRAAELALE